MNVKLAGPQQSYGWFWAHREQMLTKLKTLAVLWMVLGLDKYLKQQNCWTSAVLWMVLGPKESMLSELQTLAVLWMDFARVKKAT